MGNKQLEIILNSIADGVFTIDHKKNIRQRTVNSLSRALKKTGTLYIKEPDHTV